MKNANTIKQDLNLFGDVYQIGDILNLANAMPLTELSKMIYLLEMLVKANHKKSLKSLANMYKNELARKSTELLAKNQELQNKIKG